MGAALIEKAPAKINLTLRVCGRRADGYHDIESLVAFADVADTLTLQVGSEAGLELTGPFALVTADRSPFGCGGGTSVSMFIDTNVQQPTLPPNEVFTPQASRNTLEVM